MTKILLSFLLLAIGNSQGEENILHAEEAVKNGAPISAYHHLAPHPLYPYLQYRDYRNHLDTAPPAEIAAFLRRYPYAPFSGWLAENAFPLWLNRGDYQTIIHAYHPGFADESIECEYRLALLYSGKTRKAGENIASLWLSGKSIESACDPLFAKLAENGQLDLTLISKRFFLAMEKNNLPLARYLAGLLSAELQPAAQMWLEIRAGNLPPEHAYTLKNATWRSAVIANQLISALKNTPQSATEQALFAYRQHYLVNTEDQARLFNAVVRKIADDDNPLTLEAWNAIPAGKHDNDTIFDLIAYDLRRSDWQELPQHLIEHLDTQALNQAEVQYWLGKSFEKTNDKRRANYHYRNAAKQRDFFGFLAAEKLRQPLQMNDHPILADKDYAGVVSRPAAYRALIRHRLGDNTLAAQEWQALLKDLSPEESNQAALFAAQIDWPLQSILTLSKNKNWDALTLRFPLLYRQQIEQLAKQHHISPASIYAIIRKESIFQPEISSPSGALGLMQIMPATATSTARRYHIPYTGKQQLTNPDINLRIGSQYLTDMLEKYGHLAYAAAAYNAGPNRVERWLRQYPDLPLDEWIAQIPFYETRDYVKRVLEYEKVYEYRLGLSHRSFKNSHVRLW